MKKNVLSLFSLLIILSILISQNANAQWLKDTRQQLEIDDIKNIHSSDAHLYVLSESEGLVVFRAYSDSLQWLYSSTGMQQRGHLLESDIRFAYLYGNNRRLTVIEPTSVLGVYSSTVLPATPRSVKRVGNNLFIALGNGGLGMLSLESAESVDSDVQFLDTGRFSNNNVMDLTADAARILYVLSDNNNIDIYEIGSDEDEIFHQDRVTVNRNIDKLFLTENELYGTDNSGNIFSISSGGQTNVIGNVENPVHRLDTWNNQIVVHTENNQLWIGEPGSDLINWRNNENAGNYFTVTDNQLWITDFNQLSRIIQRNRTGEENLQATSGSAELKLQPIDNVVLPFPRPLIVPILLENEFGPGDVTFSYEAPFNNARIRGNSLYWQPSANQSGQHNVTITATSTDGQSDSIEFTVELRPFNAPPRFSPTRPVTIPVGEEFELTINAVDPDGMDQNLIRYLGVDMPSGANLNERTGTFTWAPNIRQVGEHEFRVIATDQFGAASSQNYTINVIEMEEAPPEDQF